MKTPPKKPTPPAQLTQEQQQGLSTMAYTREVARALFERWALPFEAQDHEAATERRAALSAELRAHVESLHPEGADETTQLAVSGLLGALEQAAKSPPPRSHAELASEAFAAAVAFEVAVTTYEHDRLSALFGPPARVVLADGAALPNLRA